MKISKYALSLTSILFLGCGGGSTSTSNPFAVKIYPLSEINIIEGMKKDILLTSNRPNVTYEILDENGVNVEWENRARGILTLRVDAGSSGTRSIKLEALNPSTNKKIQLTVSFNIIPSDDIPPATIKVLKTGANDGGIGVNRTFNLTEAGDIKDPLGNIWAAQSDKKLLEAKTYIGATTKCEILKLQNKDSRWRVPTKNEVLNIINYSKNTIMTEDIFEDENASYTWVQPQNNSNFILSYTNALTLKIDTFNFQKYPVRCINPVAKNYSHIVSTHRGTGDTYDYSTGLVWSPMKDDKKTLNNNNASEYCTDKGDEWRLPNINELRSISEDGMISSHIRGINTELVSSTPYNDVNSSAREAYYSIFIQDGIMNIGLSYADQSYNITCVKEL